MDKEKVSTYRRLIKELFELAQETPNPVIIIAPNELINEIHHLVDFCEIEDSSLSIGASNATRRKLIAPKRENSKLIGRIYGAWVMVADVFGITAETLQIEE